MTHMLQVDTIRYYDELDLIEKLFRVNKVNLTLTIHVPWIYLAS